MTVSVSLPAVADAFEEAHPEVHHYLDLRTGEILLFSTEEISAAEEDADLEKFPDWQRETIRQAGELLDSEQYLELPDQYEIHEYDIIERFCYTVKSDALTEQLLYEIRGSGAFRRFKNAVHYHGIADDWYAFRRNAFEEKVAAWLEANDIPFTR